jgi:hypothetical protein
MDMGGWSHAPAASSPEKDPLVAIQQEDGWAPDRVWTLEDIILYLSLPVFAPRIVQTVAVTSKTELSPLHEINRSQVLCFPRAKNRIYKHYPDRAILGFRHAVDEMTL